ncbi:hypothetical protein C0995_007742 [Termitomyces sp. Mi166|nr:hypothetical protein C0995_007742 [Termitomyces sp. Mi166\
MSKFQQVLPAELTDIIIDYLHGDVYALKACNLVCKAWQGRSRHHLFRSINLDLSLPQESLDGFLSQVARPISHFHVTHDLAALASLRGLTHLTLSCWYIGMPDAHWFSSSPNIIHLGLASCRIDCLGFEALLRHFPRLESLQLKNVSWRDYFDIKLAAQKGRVLKHLRKLHLGVNSMPVVPALTTLISEGIIEGQVEEIVLEDVEARDERIVGDFLESVGASLRSLVISAKNKLNCVSRTFALEKNINLKSIHFADLVDPTHGADHMSSRQLSFDWVIALLLQLPASTERITFTFWLIPSDKLGLDTDKRDSIDWPKLVQALGRLQRLTYVELRLNARRSHRRWIRKKCEQRLTGLAHLLQVTSIDGEQ